MVTSDEIAGEMLPATVRNEVTDLVGCKRNRTILKMGHLLFFRDISERVFVQRQHQRNTRHLRTGDDLEVIGDCHKRKRRKYTNEKSPR